jgi:hypothetical protein
MCFRCLSLGHRGGNVFHPPSMCTQKATYDEQRKDPERAEHMDQMYLQQIAELKEACTPPPQTNPAASSSTLPSATSYPTSTPPPSVSNYRYPPSHHSVGPQGPLVQPWDLHSSQSSTPMSGTFSSHVYSCPRQAHLSQVSMSHSQEVTGEFKGCN